MASRDVTIRISATDNFSQVMSAYNREMDKAEQNTKEVGKSSDDLAGTLKGLFTIAMAQQVAGYVSQMVTLGTEANATEARFTELTKTMGSYDETMNGLRTATLGTVDDMALQSGAMLLVQTAGIKTNEELDRMMRLITMTKKPSEDMTTAINNFGLMLANNSILRLDSFGISASKVRARIIELQNTLGVDRSEAFRMAVLEEGENNIQKFGAAASAASTPISRLSTSITNLYQDISQQTARGAQDIGSVIEYLLGVTPGQQAIAKANADKAAISLALDLQESFQAAMSMDTFGMDSNVISNFVSKSLELAAKDPSIMNDMDAFLSQVFRDTGITTSSEMLPVFRDILDQTLQIQAANQSERDTAIEIMDARQKEADALAESADHARNIASFTDTIADLNERNTREYVKQQQIEQQMAGIRAQYMGQLGESGGEAFSSAFKFNGQKASGSMTPEYLNQWQANDVKDAADAVALYVDQMKEADKANDALFTDDQIKNAETYSDKLNTMADDAQKAADAFANISLDELFGKSDGGTIAEELDKVTDALKRQGATETETAAAQRAFDLRSGKETLSSLAFDDQISARIADVYKQYGADAAFSLTQEFDNTMKAAAIRGIDPNNPDFVAGVTNLFQNPANMGQGFDINSFLDQFDPAARAATDMQTAIAETGTVSGDLSTNMDVATASAENFSGFMLDSNKNAGEVVAHVKTISDELAKVSKTTTKIPVELQWINPGGVIAMILPGLMQFIQGAGGVVPGTDQRASQSGSLIRGGGFQATS